MNVKSRYYSRAIALLAIVFSGCAGVQANFELPRFGLFARRTAVAPLGQEAAPPPIAANPPDKPIVPPNSTEPPAVTGTRLQTADVETATEKAIELARKLSEADNERKRLASRVEELEASMKGKDRALEQARAEIQTARAEMARAREALEHWKREITALRDKLRGADEENLQTLQTAVSLLKQILIQAEDQEESPALPAESATD